MSKDDEPNPGGELPEWDPSKEIDEDKVRREYLGVMKEMIDDYKKAKAEKERAALAPPPPAIVGGPIRRWKPPTFEDVSARMKRAWEETKKIAPDAPPFVQAEIVRELARHIDVESVEESEEGESQLI